MMLKSAEEGEQVRDILKVSNELNFVKRVSMNNFFSLICLQLPKVIYFIFALFDVAVSIIYYSFHDEFRRISYIALRGLTTAELRTSLFIADMVIIFSW